MGVSGSKGQKLFVSVLQRLLAERGLHVKESSAAEFYRFLLQVSPWFPEEGGLNLEDWKKVGREMRRYAAEHGSESIPRQAYPIWLQMREILTEQSDLVLLHAEARSEGEGESGGLLLEGLKGKTYGTTDITDRYDTKDLVEAVEKELEEPVYDLPYDEEEEQRKEKEKKEKRRQRLSGRVGTSSSRPRLGINNDDDLTPGDWDDLEEQAAHYHDRDDDFLFPVRRTLKTKPVPAPRRKLLPPVGFAGAMAQAREQGDMTFAFPVVYTGDSEDEEAPVWEPLPLKTLKELQMAVKTMGPSAPYTTQIVDMVASQWLTPHDWHQTAKATLSPGDYILWRTEYEDKSKETIQRFSGKRGPKVSLDMLLGTGSYLAPSAQVSIPKSVLKEITTNAVLAWRLIPPPGSKKTVLAGIKQGNEEPYESFVSRLEEAIHRMMPHGEGSEMLLRQLAWENANTLCQDLIRPIRKTGGIQDYVKACIDASPAVVQGMAYAAAMKGQKYSAFVKQTYGGGRGSEAANKGPVCFSCGESGHIKRDCPHENKEGKRPPPGPCPRCKKGRHWRSECCSKFDKEGKPIVDQKENESKN